MSETRDGRPAEVPDGALAAAVDDFLRAACGADASGRPRAAVAERWLATRPEIPRASAHAAAAAGDVAALGALGGELAAACAAAAGPWHAVPLIYACFSGLLATPRRQGVLAAVRLLLAQGADVNAAWIPRQEPDSPLSALYGASGRLNDPELTSVLLAAGAEPNDGESLYHAAEHRGDHRCLRLLIDHGARFAGTNALLRMLDFEDLEGLRICLAAGAEVDDGRAPHGALYHAILRGRGSAIVAELVAHGARLAARGADGRTPLMLARRLGETANVALLAASGAPEDPLDAKDAFLAAAAAGDAAAARARLAAAPDLVAGLGQADLRLLPDLAGLGRLDAVALMLDLGFPVAVKGDWDGSAINHAAARGDVPMVRLLLAHGARWDERNGFGGDAFGSALWAYFNARNPAADYLGVVRVLLAAGGEPPDDEFTDPALRQLLADCRERGGASG